jgi:hypothetical protein
VERKSEQDLMKIKTQQTMSGIFSQQSVQQQLRLAVPEGQIPFVPMNYIYNTYGNNRKVEPLNRESPQHQTQGEVA